MKKQPESHACNAPHPTDGQRLCTYDGPHPGQPHADGYGAFPEVRPRTPLDTSPYTERALQRVLTADAARERQQRAEEERQRKNRTRVEVHISADSAEALAEAIAQVWTDWNGEVKEAHYSRNPHQAFDIDYRRDVTK